MTERRTQPHKRDSRGRVIVPPKQKKIKKISPRFIGVVTSAMMLALVVTGSLLYFSMQNNAANAARIHELEQFEKKLSLVTQINDPGERDKAVKELGKELDELPWEESEA